MDERDRIIARLKAIEEYTFAKAKSGDFWSYCLYWNRDFFIKRKFLKEVVDVLQLVHDGYKTGTVVKVAISMPPRAGKCMDGNTDIYTTSGLKKIKDISIGDKVISYLDGVSTIETVVGKDKSLKKQVRIKYITGESINISPEHRLLTDSGYKAAKDITLNDFLIGYSSSLDVNNETIDCPELSKYRMDDFYYMKISEIEYIDEEIEMYDIQVTGVNNFVANGIVSHNSFTTSLFCSFMLGQFPQESIMRNSCTSSLYEDLSKSVRSMVSDDKWKRMFGIELRTKGVKTWALQTAKMNSYFGGGVGGTIIGKGATMLNISDDLYKDYKDAISDLSNDRVISWADSARGSRQELGCCTIDIGTRWRTNDIIGRGLERNDYDAVICVPALTEEGKSFCENVQTAEFYLKEMANIADEIWSAEYMQQPIEVKGRLFTPDELMYYEEIPEGEFEANLGVGDIADEGSDFTACPMFKKYGDKWYMYDVLFSKDKVEITQPILTGMINVNRVSRFRFESNNGGKLYAQNVAKTVDADVTWIPTTSNKESRILNDSAWIKKHVVFMANPQRGSDYHKFMEQLCSYLKEGKNAHDDAADSLSLFCRFVESLGFNRVKNDDRGEWPSTPISLSQIKL